MVYGWEKNLIYLYLEIIIEQITALLIFSVKTKKEKIK